ncbi:MULTISPECIES: FimV/HubP family polar landmark protein [unclassified Polaromonas]|uniref:FimV/HubP family polar landmark protein n=1 Tax=unclassified Polaromonas TaxID=2638319 RepID=UPI0018C99F37|nr:MULTISPECIES: FimV/HubP family polar landmark protein [unclassified Polaromonas]MBG6070556.1 pilus assembly protein FimV [Polaromonas sp. CG_9.7]MBG6112554.1 pilus assembly protein FimV [Polaromonas sp. CG_9.2]MDH6184205.1 pilus assembly protein FimV [Polaromonas sp. CG_23.6]
MNHPGRWRIGAMASAIALLGCLASLEAHAVALGRVTVQSALGESLRAEIDISDLSAEEASSLRVGVAGADVFRAAGLEYSSAASGLDVRLQKRADGRPYLRLTSNRAIGEPFVDLVLEARWASGRVTRDYTMLFDPPNLRNTSAPLVSSAPVLPRAPVVVSTLPSRQDTPFSNERPAARKASAESKPQAVRTLPAQSTSGARQVTVRPGDNASKIAAQNKPASVSLDQMLVALLRRNPDAFPGGNINLIKSGAVVDIPDEQAANAVSPGEARQTLVAQSRDFNTFRRKLASGVPTTQLDSTGRQADGKVQARVEDRAQANASPDRLTLSKGAVQGLQSNEQIARDAASRTADQLKNNTSSNPQPVIAGAGSAAPGLSASSASDSPSSSGAIAISAAPALNASSATVPATDASALALSEALAPESMPSASAPVPLEPDTVGQQPSLTAPPVAQPEPGLTTWIMDNSLLLGGGVLLALLAGLGFARHRKNARPSLEDSSFLDSRQQPDSFFGASGGERVDTNASRAPKSSSISYSPSQLDTSGDVDPVAEADVYMAYGRDQQAEEILREALQTHPERLAVHSKLLEIYAKRRDHKAFENAALPAFKLTGGQGEEWSHISQLGRELEPSNSMYQSGASFSPSLPGRRNSGLMPLSNTLPQALAGLAPVVKKPQAFDLDLDLDFSAGAASTELMPPAPMAAGALAYSESKVEPTPDIAIPSAFLDLDLNLDSIAATAPATEPLHISVELPASGNDLTANGLDFTTEPFKPKATIAPMTPVVHSGMLEFDLDSLSLDLGPATKPPAAVMTDLEKDPLEIKFLLAEEFRILGDSEGARLLADEVVARAKGPLKFKAQAFLNTLP